MLWTRTKYWSVLYHDCLLREYCKTREYPVLQCQTNGWTNVQTIGRTATAPATTTPPRPNDINGAKRGVQNDDSANMSYDNAATALPTRCSVAYAIAAAIADDTGTAAVRFSPPLSPPVPLNQLPQSHHFLWGGKNTQTTQLFSNINDSQIYQKLSCYH